MVIGKGIEMKDVDHRPMRFIPGDIDCPEEYVEHKRYKLEFDQVAYHGLPTAGILTVGVEAEEVILALAKGGYGWYAVDLLVNPFIAKTRMYNSHHDLGVATTLRLQEEKARENYEGIAKLLEQGNFKVHVFSNSTIGLEEIAKD